MVSQRLARSSRTVTDTNHGETETRRPEGTSLSPCLGASVARIGNYPALWIVVFEVLTPRNPADDHRLRDPPLVRTDCEVNMCDDETHQRDASHAVCDVDE